MAWRRYLSTLSACPLRRCRLLAFPGGRLAARRSIRPQLPPHTIHTPTDPRMALLAAITPIHHAISASRTLRLLRTATWSCRNSLVRRRPCWNRRGHGGSRSVHEFFAKIARHAFGKGAAFCYAVAVAVSGQLAYNYLRRPDRVPPPAAVTVPGPSPASGSGAAAVAPIPAVTP